MQYQGNVVDGMEMNHDRHVAFFGSEKIGNATKQKTHIKSMIIIL